MINSRKLAPWIMWPLSVLAAFCVGFNIADTSRTEEYVRDMDAQTQRCSEIVNEVSNTWKHSLNNVRDDCIKNIHELGAKK